MALTLNNLLRRIQCLCKRIDDLEVLVGEGVVQDTLYTGSGSLSGDTTVTGLGSDLIFEDINDFEVNTTDDIRFTFDGQFQLGGTGVNTEIILLQPLPSQNTSPYVLVSNGGVGDLVRTITQADLKTNLGLQSIVETIGFTVDGGGEVITTGKVKGYFTVPYAGTISGWNIMADTGTCTIKVWKLDSTASPTSVPTIANVINTSGVSLSSGTAVHSSTVTDFTTTAVSVRDVFAYDITAVSGCTEITFNLEITRIL